MGRTIQNLLDAIGELLQCIFVDPFLGVSGDPDPTGEYDFEDSDIEDGEEGYEPAPRESWWFERMDED
jgi:hypothetical protein